MSKNTTTAPSVKRQERDEKYADLCARYRKQGLENWDEQAYSEVYKPKRTVSLVEDRGRRKGTRREPLLPRGLTRFNYWRQAIFAPVSSDEWEDHRVLLHDAKKLQNQLAEEFARHLAGRCKQRVCPWEWALEGSTTDQRVPILLRHYIKTDRLWWRNKEAWKILRSLPVKAQTALLRLHRQRGRQSHRRWTTMFTIIKRDQEVFRDLIKELTQDGLSLEGAVVRAAKKLGRSESMVLRVYLEYRAKAALLRDEETNADQLERTLKQLDRRQSISGNNLDALRKLVTEAKAQSPPIVGKDGGLAMVSAPRPPVCRNWEDVLTWFAHALQNMKRYHNGHPPLPWRHSPSP